MDTSPPAVSWLPQAAVSRTQALICGTCAFWQPHDRLYDYRAPCMLDVYYGDPPFDYSGCGYHSQRDAVPDM